MANQKENTTRRQPTTNPAHKFDFSYSLIDRYMPSYRQRESHRGHPKAM
jgi:hypothetical protein